VSLSNLVFLGVLTNLKCKHNKRKKLANYHLAKVLSVELFVIRLSQLARPYQCGLAVAHLLT